MTVMRPHLMMTVGFGKCRCGFGCGFFFPPPPLQIFRKLCERLKCRAQPANLTGERNPWTKGSCQRLPRQGWLGANPSSLRVSPLYCLIKPIMPNRTFYCWINNPLTRFSGIYTSHLECLIEMQHNFHSMS